MSCGRLALEKAGFKVDTYYASEIDKHAIKVSGANWPGIIQVGDVTAWKSWDLLHGLDWASIDLVIGGSPCQGFSFAGKQLAFDDPRSALFFTFVDILNHVRKHNPKVKFILENVKMKKDHLEVITDYMGVEPILINSALVSAQNRNRYYWTNIDGIEQPEDKGFIMSDILAVATSEIKKNYGLFGLWDAKLSRDRPGFKKNASRLTLLASLYSPDRHRVKNTPCLLCSIEGDTPSGVSRQSDRVYSHLGKSPCLTAFGQGVKVLDSLDFKNVRYLTPIECERLQTVPDNYTNCVSDSQRYRMLGNGWNVDTIVHLLSYYK
jgi:DNA-cytosine methyltransferase